MSGFPDYSVHLLSWSGRSGRSGKLIYVSQQGDDFDDRST
jgi:hypothetical protein